MAIAREPRASRLQVVVQIGLSDTGQPLLRTRSYSGIKVDALDADLYDIAQALAALQQYPVNSIVRVDDGELVEQP